MKGFHVITGMPRSGSTLLCNILNQNPKFYASSTSPILELLQAVSARISHSAEIQAALHADEKTSERITEMCRAMITSWYSHKVDCIIFDKARQWSFHSNLLRSLYPKAKIITTVRDLRNIFASVEKQHQKQPLFDTAPNFEEKTITGRAGAMFGNDGMIGQCAVGLQDLFERNQDRTMTIKYEAFTRDPMDMLRRLYDFLEVPWFEHDLEHVKKTAEDLDVLWLNKFPHDGSGKVVETDRNEWKEYLQPNLARDIMRAHPKYNEIFGYG